VEFHSETRRHSQRHFPPNHCLGTTGVVWRCRTGRTSRGVLTSEKPPTWTWRTWSCTPTVSSGGSPALGTSNSPESGTLSPFHKPLVGYCASTLTTLLPQPSRLCCLNPHDFVASTLTTLLPQPSRLCCLNPHDFVGFGASLHGLLHVALALVATMPLSMAVMVCVLFEVRDPSRSLHRVCRPAPPPPGEGMCGKLAAFDGRHDEGVDALEEM